ncbi:MAG: RNA-binding protein [Candidatus Korarchaeota archaeon]|nr:RNA-binding protein [Candidatus Korarchaeota archaeon]
MRAIPGRKYAITVKQSKTIIDRAVKEIRSMSNIFSKRKISLQVLEVPWKGKVAKVYYYEGEPVLVELPTEDNDLIPFLTAVEKFGLDLPKVVVDLGAVKPIASGAHVMGPGIKEVMGDFDEGDLVVVVDERLRATIAIGRALRPPDQIKERGRSVKNLHHAGDAIWRAVAAESG